MNKYVLRGNISRDFSPIVMREVSLEKYYSPLKSIVITSSSIVSSSLHSDGDSYADKLKNPLMRKNQQKLKNQHAGNRPLS